MSRSRESQALTALEAFLKDLLAKDDPGTSVTVHTFTGDLTRISEISAVTTNKAGMPAGCSWMRSEPEAGSVILQAEDFLLTYGDEPERWGPGEDEVHDSHAETKERLAWLLTHEPV